MRRFLSSARAATAKWVWYRSCAGSALAQHMAAHRRVPSVCREAAVPTLQRRQRGTQRVSIHAVQRAAGRDCGLHATCAPQHGQAARHPPAIARVGQLHK